MAVDVGSAVGYLDLDISGFINGLKTAQGEAGKSMNQIESLGSKITGVGDKISSAGSTLTKTVTLPLAGVATAGLKVATDFEKGMSEVRAITGATGSDFDELKAKAVELGASTAFSAGEVAAAMTEMAKAGWNTDQIISGMGGVLDAAAASGEGLASVSTIVADAITGFGLAASDSGRVADLLTQAANSGTIGVNDLGESFKYIAPVAQSMGLSIEDVTTAIAAMSMAGIKGSQAGTSLRTMLTNLVKPTDAIAIAMEKLGISASNSDGSMKSLDEIVASLRTAFSGLTDEQKSYYAATLAGKEGMSGLLSLLNLTEQEYNEIAASMDNAKGVAQETAEVMQDNLQSKFEQLMGSLESLAIVLADHVIPPLTSFVEWLTSCIEKFTQLDPATQKVILTVAGIAAAVGPVILVVGKLVSVVGGAVTTIGKISSVFGSFGSAASAAAGPAQSAAAGVGGLAKSALNLLAAGAGIALAATGLALLAQSAIALADAGTPAIAVMGGLVVALAGLAVGAAAIAAPLTAGAAGLVAFGGAIALVGTGVLAATAGVALLATQLPTIAEYGSQGALAITELSGALVVFGGGTAVAGSGCIVLGAGLTTVAVGATAAGVGVTALSVGIAALSVGVLALSAGITALGAGLTLCGTGMTLLAATSGTAATGLTAFTAAAIAAFVPITAGTASIAALDIAVLAAVVTFGAFTVELGLAAAATGLLATAMESTAVSVTSIEQTAQSAGKSLQDMVKSVDVVKQGLDGLGTIASNAVEAFISVFSNAAPAASSTALELATGVTNSMNEGLSPIAPNTFKIMDETNGIVTNAMMLMTTIIIGNMNMSVTAVTSGMSQMNAATTIGMNQMNTTIKSGFESAVSYIKSLAGQSRSWGADIMQGLINGMQSKMSALQSTVNQAANVIYKNLHFTRPDEGPLRNYEEWMPHFMEGLSKGIHDNSHLVKSAVQDVASNMEIEPDSSIVNGLFAASDVSNLETYNVTLLDTLGIYKQLVEQMKLYSEYSTIATPIDNNLLRQAKSEVAAVEETNDKNNDKNGEGKKPDQLVIPINIGEEQVETLIVDLLRREVRT